jgi:NADH-quinone oxidoreductase subunit K
MTIKFLLISDFFNFKTFINAFYSFQKIFILKFLNVNEFFFEDPCLIGYYLFLIGLFSLSFGQKNLLFFMVYIELMLLGLSYNFIFASISLSNLSGYLYAFLILNLAAAESAIGLSLLITIFSIKKSISFNALSSLKG